jgi:hypothetical protein
VLNSLGTMSCRHGEEWRYSTAIPDLGTYAAEWLYSRPCRFTPGGNRFRSPLDKRLGGPWSLSGRYGQEENVVIAGNRTPAVQPVARRYID